MENPLNFEVNDGIALIVEGFKKANQNVDVKGIILNCAGPTIFASADSHLR